jgi:hypothetical protein
VCFAVVISLALDASPSALMLLAIWSATFGLLSLKLPQIWQERVRFIITERYVVCERGPFRRMIERRSVSFARIAWDKSHPGVGDLELVRAVPTGALRRKLRITLSGVAAPDKVWDIVRGVDSPSQPYRGDRVLGQRLELGERVIWSGGPRPRFTYLPRGTRGWYGLALAGTLLAGGIQLAARSPRILSKLIDAGLMEQPAALAALTLALALTTAITLAFGFGVLYQAIILPGRHLRSTRYLITNRRVLIQRATDELHLDRDKVVDIIDAPALKGATDLFLVLDGPQARALAMSGAFGEIDRSPELRPILESVVDVDGATRTLRDAPRRREASLPPAA